MPTYSGVARLAADAELRETPKTKVLSMRLAFDAGWDSRKSEKRTLWVNAAVFGAQAERLAPLLTKGKQIDVSGELFMETYERRDGTDGQALSLNVDRVNLVGGRSEGQAEAPAAPSRTSAQTTDLGFGDAIPF